MLNAFILIIGVLVIAAVLVGMRTLIPPTRKQPDTFPYQKESALFTPAERSFLGVLEQALGEQYRVMGKVRLADVLKVRPGLNGAVWQSAFNRIQSKHLDFIVCSAKDLTIQCAVELDDQSHDRAKRQARDGFVDQALQAAGVPIVHVAAKRSYSVPEVQGALAGIAAVVRR